MGFFSYSVQTPEGKITHGSLEADTKEKALEFLHSQGDIILSLKQERGKKSSAKKGRVKTGDLVIFSRQLTTLIESAIPVVNALEILVDQIESPFFKHVVSAVVTDLKGGTPFAPSLAKYPNVFPEIYISMVEAAETSGNLPAILDQLSLYLEKMSALRKKIVSAMVYPAVVIVMISSMTGFLLLKIVPTFKDLYDSLHAKLPLPTQILIAISDVLKKQLFTIIAIFVITLIAFRKYVSTPSGKKRFHQFILKLPVFGDIFKKISIAKFSRTFATLVHSSVPVTTSLEIVAKTSGNKVIEEVVLNAKKSIQEGVPISQPLSENNIFPPMVVKMIAVGEKSGKLEHMLMKIAQFYEEQTDAVISALASLIEPVLIVVLGFIVGFIVIAMFLPIINLSQIIVRQ